MKRVIIILGVLILFGASSCEKTKTCKCTLKDGTVVKGIVAQSRENCGSVYVYNSSSCTEE